ncbi:hypothetical protein NDU88_003863 [Pleurodeles waltl]|uniref:Uncharacterized protein n=1 Tax=Pleurodeles waltl TaxID=8319 RepID=A0AAV7VJ23_PLEWA|nr:hypothetical protein NDU88_003863 [Pleurodeles waltl]
MAGGVQRTLTCDLQPIEAELREVECRVASSAEDQGKLVGLKRNWAEVDSRLRQFDYLHHIAQLHSEGDRSSRLLAWLVKGEHQHTHISTIQLDSGAIVNAQLEINEAFRQYYSTLYMTCPPPPPERLEDFFQALQLTRLTAPQLQELEKPIEMDEIKQTLQQLAHNKAPGGDGLGADYIQTFSTQTLTPYLEMLTEAFEVGRLLKSHREVVIVVLFKKGCDPLDVWSYRPLSLLNSDCKLLGKVLANCQFWSTRINMVLYLDVAPSSISDAC